MAMHKLCVCCTAFYQSPLRQVRQHGSHLGKGTKSPQGDQTSIEMNVDMVKLTQFNVTIGQKKHTHMKRQ